MCLKHYNKQKINKKFNLKNFYHGFINANKGKITYKWKNWSDEWLWQTLYFSFGTWASLYMCMK